MKKIILLSISFLFLAVTSVYAVDSVSTLKEKAMQRVQDQKTLALERKEDVASRVAEVKEKAQQKIMGTLQERARREIKRRVNALNKILERITKIKKLSDTQKTALDTQIQGEIQKLTDLDTKIAGETDPAVIKTDAQSIIKSYRIYAFFIPKIHILGASDAMQNATVKLDEISVRLETKITEAEGAGKDVNDLRILLSDMKEKTASASSQAKKADDLVLPLTPDGYPDNKTTLKEARDLLVLGHKDIQDARQNAVKIITSLKEVGISPSSASNSSNSTPAAATQ